MIKSYEMRTLISAVFFLLACGFTANAQEAKKGPQTKTNKEACCADHKASKDEAKCCAKAPSDSKRDDKAEASCATTHTCKADGSCCGEKNPPKKG